MRYPLTLLIFGLLVSSILSCSTSKIDFPVSTITPAADASITVKKDDNNNYAIQLVARYLASPERLTPRRNTYVLWAKTAENGVKNIGQLSSKSSKVLKFKTSIPFQPIQFFVTAEEEATVQWPSYQEIFRSRIFTTK